MKYRVIEGRFLTPHGRWATMFLRGHTNDHNTLTASMNQDEYLLPEGLSGKALDIGGYLGSVGISLALDNPDLDVTIVEPVPANADLIVRNLEANGLTERVTLIRGAIDKGGERVTVGFGYRGSESLEHHAFVGNSSIAEAGAEHEEVVYTALSLASFGPSVYTKIDTEGAEWAALTDPKANALSAVIVGESHAVAGHKGKDIIALLQDTHDVYLSGDPDGTCGFTATRR